MDYFPKTNRARRHHALQAMILTLILGTFVAASLVLPRQLVFSADDTGSTDWPQASPACGQSFLFSAECPQ